MALALRILPGLDGTGRLSDPFLAAVRQHGIANASAIAYPANRCLDHDALADHARQRLPRDSEFVLLAESFSGPIGISIAADPPPGLRGLILSTTFARAPLPRCGPLAPLLRYAPVHSAPNALLSPLLLGRWSTPALRSALRATLREVPADVLRHRAALSLHVDRSACLTHIRVPTLILQAKQDRLVSARVSGALVAGVTGSRLESLDGPHLLLQTRVEACSRLVAGFMDAVREDRED